jgi:hypothetical protein
MKIAISLLAFAMTLALTAKSLANEGGHEEGGEHHGLAAKMNALFPQPADHPDKRKVPEKPELSSPAYFTEIKGDKATLQWKAVEGADEYHVQVATDPNFKWLAANDYHVKATSFDVSGLEAGKHYFWRVAAVKSENWKTFRRSFFAGSMFATAGAAQ